MEGQYSEQPQETIIVYVGFWARVFAYIIDCLILMIPNAILSLFIDGSVIDTTWRSNLPTIILGWLYFSLMESGVRQATLGKRVLDMKVTDMRGGRISFARATGRYFSKIISAIILLIGFIMVAFDSRKQGLHDKIAETLVVSTER